MIQYNTQLLSIQQHFKIYYYLTKLLSSKNFLSYIYALNYVLLLTKKKVYFIDRKKIYWTITKKHLSLMITTPVKLQSYPFLLLAGKFIKKRKKSFREYRDMIKAFKRKRKNYKFARVNFLRFSSLNKPLFKKTLNNFSLKQRIFLSKKIIVQTVWSFLYTKVKYKFLKKQIKSSPLFTKIKLARKKKKILVNGNKPLVWKMRKARYAHWELRTRGKLNEYRYHKLLGKELHFISTVKTFQFLSLILLNTLCCAVSWRQLILLVSSNLIVYNGSQNMLPQFINIGDIVELPFGSALVRTKKKIQNHYRVVVGRSKRTSYKAFLSFKNKKSHLRKHINVPKVFKKLPAGLKYLGKAVAYDPAMNMLAVLYPLSTTGYNISDYLTYTSVLSLQNWRYRFD